MASNIIQPGAHLIFMKVGLHAQESFEDIVERKRLELENAGQIFWGYGGNTCHPTNLVQPFAKTALAEGSPVHLVMTRMNSRHYATPAVAREYSDDGIDWKPIPKGIEVRGSRYALVLRDLEEGDFDLNLSQVRVAVGPSRGKTGSDYIRTQVDKGCFTVAPTPELAEPGQLKRIDFTAALQPPFAVFLR